MTSKFFLERVFCMPTDKKQFTLRLQEDNFEKIKYIAEENKRSIAMQIEYLIVQAIKEYEDEHGVILLYK